MCLGRSQWPGKWEVPARRPDLELETPESGPGSGDAKPRLRGGHLSPTVTRTWESVGLQGGPPAGSLVEGCDGLCYSFDVGVRNSAECAEVSGRCQTEGQKEALRKILRTMGD